MTDDDLVREMARARRDEIRRETGVSAPEDEMLGILVDADARFMRAALARYREIMRERVPYRIDGPGVKGAQAAAYIDGHNRARRVILGDDA